MVAKISWTGPGVKKIKIAKYQGKFSIFNIDEHKSFPKICKQNYEFKLKSKNLQVSDCFNKLGKSILLERNDMLYVLKFLLWTRRNKLICLYYFKFFKELNVK